MKKRLLMITCRDIHFPLAGGTEILTHNILKRLIHHYDITVLTSAFPKCEFKEIIDGIQYIRLGNKRSFFSKINNWKIYLEVFKYYHKHLADKGKYDVVIEQINIFPFFYSLYGDKNTFLFIPQLCRKNWFHLYPWYLAWIGYFLFEPLSLFFLRNKQIITVSESSKNDLLNFGFKNENIHIISEGISLSPVESLINIQKYPLFTLLSIGDICPLKRTGDQIRAFTYAKRLIPELQLKIVGSAKGEYGKKILNLINTHPHKKDIQYRETVSVEKKQELMQKSHIILSTSEKEGWDIIVTEAGSQGTPAVVYNSDGLRDSVKHAKTGLICKINTPEEMAQKIFQMKNRDVYLSFCTNAWNMSKWVTFDASAIDFNRVIVDYFSQHSFHGFLRLRRIEYRKF